MKQLTEERLAKRAACADERAFATIFQRYNQEIYRFCLSILGNAEDARDALQNTMVKALQALPGEKREIKLRPWLYRVAHNQSIDLLRRRRAMATVDPELVAPGDGLAETAAQRERLRQLLRDLTELPERQRAALLMRELGGLEFAQIGEAFETSPGVARQTVYEARVSLRGLEEGREMSCEEVMHRLSNADGRVIRRRDIQAHLRACAGCRDFRDSIDTRRHDLAAIGPLPAVASAGILHAILGGGAGTASGTATVGGATVAAGAGKAVTAGVVAKSVATVAVVAAVGVSTANRTGLIDTHLPGSGAGSAASRHSSNAQGGSEAVIDSQAAGEPQQAGGETAGNAGSRPGAKGFGRSGHGNGRSAAGAKGVPHGRGAADSPAAGAAPGRGTAAAHGGGSSNAQGASHGPSASPHGSGHRHGHQRSRGGSSRRHPAASAPPKARAEPSGGGQVSAPSSGTGESSSNAGGSETEAAKTGSEGSP